MLNREFMGKERQRLDEANSKKNNWKKWGPYLSERGERPDA